MTSLDSPQVRAVFECLYGEAERTDSWVLPRVRAEIERLGGPFDDSKVAGFLDDAFIPVAPEVGRLLYVLVRSRRPTIAVEFGTSFGLSAIHIAAALRDNGTGKLVATELNPTKASRAVEHLRQAGFGDLVEVRQGDAFETLSDVTGIDFLLLDGWKRLYLPMLKKLEPALNAGSLIVADDLKIMPEMLQPYLTYVRDPENGYTSNELPLDDGLELSLRG
ncbi:MAG: class I SAM-dependent methyltransferase [Syntrophobacteraceae bacterium]|jgi:predicted O-methyltransferase YrrM